MSISYLQDPIKNIGSSFLDNVVKPPVRLLIDVPAHLALRTMELVAGTTNTPIPSLVSTEEEFQSNWTLTQGIKHIAYAILFATDAIASPVINFISPSLYNRFHRTTNNTPVYQPQGFLRVPNTEEPKATMKADCPEAP